MQWDLGQLWIESVKQEKNSSKNYAFRALSGKKWESVGGDLRQPETTNGLPRDCWIYTDAKFGIRFYA